MRRDFSLVYQYVIWIDFIRFHLSCPSYYDVEYLVGIIELLTVGLEQAQHTSFPMERKAVLRHLVANSLKSSHEKFKHI